jgi:hypothetical protein
VLQYGSELLSKGARGRKENVDKQGSDSESVMTVSFRIVRLVNISTLQKFNKAIELEYIFILKAIFAYFK